MTFSRSIALILTLALIQSLAAAAQDLPTYSGTGVRTTEQIGWVSTFEGRLAIIWLTELGGEIVAVGKTFRPNAMHRVTVAVTGKKAPGANKEDASLLALGNSGQENRIEQVLGATYPLTVRATLRVPERLPRQGKPAILKKRPEPGMSIGVFCRLTAEERTQCDATDDAFVAVDRATCERLADASDRLDAADCAELPEVSPVASVLELQSRDGQAEPGR